MSELPADQGRIDRTIVDELFAIVPEDWDAFVMTVEPREADGDGQAITILHPERADAEVEPSAPIRAAVAELAAFFAREGRRWERLTYAAHTDGDGAWRVRITAPLPPAS